MSEGKCEKCGSTNGNGSYCSGFCGNPECHELKYWFCSDCKHTTRYFHITARGKKILEILLEEDSYFKENSEE